MRQPERSTIPSALFSANGKKKFTFQRRTHSLVPFAEIMRQPREAAKREFSPLQEIKVRLKVLRQLVMAKVSVAKKKRAGVNNLTQHAIHYFQLDRWKVCETGRHLGAGLNSKLYILLFVE